jgi:anthranilate phosphoribosyltransferase
VIAALRRLGEGQDLTADEAHEAVAAVLGGRSSDVVTAAFLTALRIKGETTGELAGAVRAVRERMVPFSPSATLALLDTCGTGGDLANTVNISTGAAILVAACGVPVAKHGNRAASGNSGSAEVLAALGIAIEAGPAVLERCLTELGIAFLFAPRFHPALRALAPVRRALPFRTLFNLLGPLANPARPAFQLVGVPAEGQAILIAETLATLGVHRAAVATGCDGLDEVTLGGPTRVRLVDERGQVTPTTWEPADFGLTRVAGHELRVSGPAESALRLSAAFGGEPGPVRQVLLANAAAALWVAGRQASLRDGVALAAEAIDSGAAARLVARWAQLSQMS